MRRWPLILQIIVLVAVIALIVFMTWATFIVRLP